MYIPRVSPDSPIVRGEGAPLFVRRFTTVSWRRKRPPYYEGQRCVKLSPHFPSTQSNTPSDNSDMRLPFDELSIRSQQPLPDSKEGVVGSEEVKEGLCGTTESSVEREEAEINAQRYEIFRLRSRGEKYAKKYRETKERIAELEHHIGEVSEAHQETLEKQDPRIQAMAEQLKRTEQLLATRSAELAGAQYFLSTTDRLSEADVLSVVHDLNENVFQVAANLTEEWEKLGSSRSSEFTITQDGIDALSRFYGPALIRSAFDRSPAGITFLVQSCLCNVVAQITSRWRHDQELAMLGSVYQRLSASGEHISYAVSEMRLTYPRGTSNLC